MHAEYQYHLLEMPWGYTFNYLVLQLGNIEHILIITNKSAYDHNQVIEQVSAWLYSLFRKIIDWAWKSISPSSGMQLNNSVLSYSQKDWPNVRSKRIISCCNVASNKSSPR